MKYTIVACLAAILCLLGAIPLTASSAEPTFPHAFYGDVTISGTPAANGTVVEARGEGVLIGIEGNPITVSEAGRYGAPGAFDPKLVVQGDITDGTNVSFYVNNVIAQCYDVQAGGEWLDSYPFKSGNVTVLNLKVTGATLEGHVSFPVARVGGLVEPFVVKLFEHGNLSNVLWTGSATTNSTGVFNITGVTPDTYDIGIKNATCVSELESGKVLTAGNTTVVNFTIREGDVDSSDFVDMGDYADFSYAFGTSPTDAKWNANADLDRSGYIDMGDYAIFSYNFREMGDAYGCF